VCCSVAADDRRASEVRVDEIMQPASACCATDDSLSDARRKMHQHRTTTLPVVDKAGCCCGTVSIHHVGP
jgi:CBS-domain-containing membrane protein